jgi:hypothetical protein
MEFIYQRTFFALANTIRSLLQFRLKGSPMNKSAQTSTAAAEE